MNILKCTPTSVSVELENQDAFYTKEYEIYLNNEFVCKDNHNVFTLYDLCPGKHYVIIIKHAEYEESGDFETLNLKEKVYHSDHDGTQIDETKALQEAIDALLPGEFLTVQGIYKVVALFLKNDLYLHIPKGSGLIGETNRECFPILRAEEEKNGIVLGTWEGYADDSFASIITGIGVKNVCIYGAGIVDCNAQNSDWWINHRVKIIARRPKGIFLHTCNDVSLIGITVCNTPSWNQHPFYCKNVQYINVNLENPASSPTTDGIDPESCDGVLVVGTRISVGDDCIAIKSGKIDFARKYRTPSQNIMIRNCLMEYGHAGVTIGSENSGGVKNVTVTNCIFRGTDRGLRIKSQRGRGNLAIIDNITFRNIYMDDVKSPFVINAFYKAGTDAVDERFERGFMPVSELTPQFRDFCFEDIVCENVSFGVGYFLGLPESMLRRVILKNVSVTFKPDAEAGEMAMTAWKEEFKHAGFVCENLEELILENVLFQTEPVEKFRLQNVLKVEEV